MVPASVPPSLSAAPELMLARAVETIDESDHMPGGTAWSWKWDGYRLAAVVDDQAVTLWSRNGKDLTASFPDLRDAIADQVPTGTVLDGEAVVWGSDERLDFSALQRRLATKRAERLARVQPANYVAFDVLAVAGRGVRDRPRARRHELLEGLAGEWRPPLTQMASTRSRTASTSSATWRTEELRRRPGRLGPAEHLGVAADRAKTAASRSGRRYGVAVARSTGGEQGRGGRLAAVLGVVVMLLAAVLYLWGGQLYAHGHNDAQGLCDERNGHLSWQAAVPSGWVCETPDQTLFLGWSPTGVPSDPDPYSTS